MKELFNNLMQKLDADLSANDEEQNLLKRISKNILLVEEAIGELFRAVSLDRPYHSEESTQIEYNKHYFPPLYAKRIFYKKCYEGENQRLHSSEEQYRSYCVNELMRIQEFFSTHSSFCQNFYSGNTENDWILFTTLTEDEYRLPDAGHLFPSNSNPNTLLLACLLAYEQYAALLRKQGQYGNSITGQEDNVEIVYKGQLIDLVELAMGVYVSKDIHVNGKPATQEFFRIAIERFLGVSLKYWDGMVQKLSTRKDQFSKHHDNIRKLSAHFSRIPEDRSRRKSA